MSDGPQPEHVVPLDRTEDRRQEPADARRPKQRVPKPYSALRPGSPEAVRKGCKCSTITGAVSPFCPHHQRGYSNA